MKGNLSGDQNMREKKGGGEDMWMLYPVKYV